MMPKLPHGSDMMTARRRRSRLEVKRTVLIAVRNPGWNSPCRDGDHPAIASRISAAVSGHGAGEPAHSSPAGSDAVLTSA